MSDFLAWLNSDPLPEDIVPLPWNPSIVYIPIETIRNKFTIMEQQFGAVVEQLEVFANAMNTIDKDTLVWASVKFIIYHKELPNGKKTICGTASFLRGQYPNGWAYMQIAESLSCSRAFSKEWKQFGKGLNKVDSIEDLKSPTGAKKENAVSETFKKLK